MHRTTVVIVSNDEFLSEVLKETTKAMKYEVYCYDGVSKLDYNIRDISPQVVITSCVETLKEIQSLSEDVLRGVELVLVSDEDFNDSSGVTLIKSPLSPIELKMVLEKIHKAQHTNLN